MTSNSTQQARDTLWYMNKELQELSSKDFPPMLSEIPDAPKKLYLRGTMPNTDNTKWLTVVGSRAYTPYGKEAAEYLIKGLSGYPVAIVSGLALGIDAIAHKAALDAGLPTVAVPGSGLDWNVLYPRNNVALGKAIIESGGAHLSEFEPNFKAEKWSFLQRNRIMAGISHATLIIEATEKSGTMVTARLATDYNRDVLVVPGSIFNKTSRGNHNYLRHGATPINNADDILDALNINQQSELPIIERSDITDDERAILALLSSPIPRDELIRSLKLPTARVGTTLSTMELKGLIEESMGMIKSLI